MVQDLKERVKTASKWSVVTEIAAKLVAPISTIILARLLSPEAFGVLVTVTMVITFAEIFTDAGFQKYIVQHDFKSKSELYKATTVAFWTNLLFSLLIWGVITVFGNELADLVGNSGYGHVISVASICIPLAAFSSLQMAIFRRELDFKTLFKVRIIGIFIPIVITIPIAFVSRSYWALIIGMIALNISNAILLSVKSNWKPTKFYSFRVFREMISFSIWSLIEAITIWLTGYVDVFLIGKYLDEYYVGLYRTSISTVGQIVGLITAASTPVLFSALSRLQTDKKGFDQMFLKFQKIVGIMVIPLGVGIFIFNKLITFFLLGSQWSQAAYFIGLWGLTSSITIVLSHYCSEVYRAIGKPKLSVLVQISQIICLVPIVMWALPKGFDFLCTSRATIRLELVFANMIIMWIVIKISPWKMIKNIFPALFSSCMSGILVLLLPNINNNYISILYLLLGLLIYCILIIQFPKERKIILNLKNFIRIC